MAILNGHATDVGPSDLFGAPAGTGSEEAARRSSTPQKASRQASEPVLSFKAALDAFATAWEEGRTTKVDEFVGRLHPDDTQSAVELVYREFCLAEAAGWQPEIARYLERFPRHREALERLLDLHVECSLSLLDRWVNCSPAERHLPAAGDEIGPFVLRRELGRGSFARVFLAEQTNLENRLVVVKVSTRMSREPWLLARVRHAHIVEIVSHAPVNDGALHLICMPFWGGATLAAVLAAARARERPPVSGRDLLADLDAVAAPEYPAVHPARPAREVLAALRYDQALAWVGARLADALDYAFSRQVAHGDVKPSNILLTADGNPMLLDFNLARDGSPLAPIGQAHDVGGTLAYMAPERLAALAALGWAPLHLPGDETTVCEQATSGAWDQAEAAADESSLDPAAHRADLYSLGVVLLEALTGWDASRPQASFQEDDRSDGTSSTQARARSAAIARAMSARPIVVQAQEKGGRALRPSLRAILARCLDADPSRRYRHGRELADDLDRWRADRPLAFAPEPFWGYTVPRKLRRGRRVLVATALSLTVAAAASVLSFFHSSQTLAVLARDKLAPVRRPRGVSLSAVEQGLGRDRARDFDGIIARGICHPAWTRRFTPYPA